MGGWEAIICTNTEVKMCTYNYYIRIAGAFKNL